ncbi:hypothetical protein AGMMS49983_10740 [Clostridia bacterium]|nr:hypothetical protein AGMMS49983_10740 [Clostridia bacterium]
MSSAASPERVCVYLLSDIDTKASAEERARVSRRFVADSVRRYCEQEGRAVSETAIQGLVVGTLTDGTPAFEYGTHGKPFFADPALKDLYFSLSHTREIEVCAVCRTAVGCDIEYPKFRHLEAARMVKIAKRFFAPDEFEKLLPDPAGTFFSIWTKKEAYVKWTGNGFAEGFSSFSVFDLPEGVVCEKRILTGVEDAECAVCYEWGF